MEKQQQPKAIEAETEQLTDEQIEKVAADDGFPLIPETDIIAPHGLTTGIKYKP